MKSRVRWFVVVLFFAAAVVGSGATVSFNFTSSLLFARPGQTVTFSGTLTNTGPATAFLNGDAFTFPLPVDDIPFFLGVPPSLAPGGSVTAPVLTAIVPAGTALGLYVGSFSVIGGDTPASQNVLATREFGVQVIPEPATCSLAIGGLVGAVLLRRQRR